MPKFYWKSGVAWATLTVLALLMFNMVRGITVTNIHRKIIFLLIVGDIFYLILNEKATTRESWNWWMWLVLFVIVGLSSVLVLFLL